MASRLFESGFLSVENVDKFEYILESKYGTDYFARKVKGYLLHYLNFRMANLLLQKVLDYNMLLDFHTFLRP